MARKILAAAGAAAAAGPLLKAGFDGARFASRSRSARRNGQPLAPGVPAPDPTLALGLSVALDRVFTMPMGLLASAFGDEHYERSSAELDQALQYYEARGWLTAVDGFFDPPTSEGTFVVESSQRPGSEHLSFESGWTRTTVRSAATGGAPSPPTQPCR